MEKLNAISPLDGRYRNKVEILSDYFSEKALINFRIKSECEYLIFLLDQLSQKNNKIKKISVKDKDIIKEIYKDDIQNALNVKKIEFSGDLDIPATNHDVKSVEYYLKKQLKLKGFSNNLEFLHFALTSEDINNISYSLMINLAIKDVMLKEIDLILNNLKFFSIKYANNILLARTHGQFAVGTTFGKEFRNFYERIKRQRDLIKNIKINVKLNGAVGNYNAHNSAFKNYDWISFSEKFVSYLNKNFNTQLSCNLYTTQIENHDSWVEIFDAFSHLNRILINFVQDIWLYISNEMIIQKPIKGEIGSSTMPHKINPIDFENAEGNLLLASALFSLFSSKLPISRLQRDLSDSTVERNIGSAFAYSLLAYKSILKGLTKIEINEEKSENLFFSEPQIYAEAIQTILRREGFTKSYELLKNFTRGKKVSKLGLLKFINSLKISKKLKIELIEIINKPYIGLSEKLAKYKITK